MIALSGLRRTLALLLLMLTVLGTVSGSAHADGGGGCGAAGGCGAWDDIPGDPPKGNGDDNHNAVQYPLCSSIAHSSSTRPKDKVGTPDDPGSIHYVQIKCRTSDGGTSSVWAPEPCTVDVCSGVEVDPAVLARSLLASMQLKPISIGMAPPVRSYVGIPVWMWADEPGRLTYGPATITAGGVSLTAKVTKVVWSMGDGSSVTCQKGTEWTKAKAGGSSPTCGHTYTKQGRYTVTARSYWVATWSGYGQSGTIPFTLESSRQLQVGEIQVITTRR